MSARVFLGSASARRRKARELSELREPPPSGLAQTVRVLRVSFHGGVKDILSQVWVSNM